MRGDITINPLSVLTLYPPAGWPVNFKIMMSTTVVFLRFDLDLHLCKQILKHVLST